jgi:hypothetical protein
MHIVLVGWIYVVLMMAVAEALSTQGTVLGAVFTFLLYGVLPLSIVMYVMATPQRRRARRAAERAASEVVAGPPQDDLPPSGGGVGEARPWGHSHLVAGPPQDDWPPSGGGVGAARPRERSDPPDGGGKAAGDAVAPERKEG